MVEGVRFLHASGLQLGSPLFGVGGLPYDLRSIMVNARYRAAARIFAAAIEAQVDFVLLSGDVLGETALAPRSCWFQSASLHVRRRRSMLPGGRTAGIRTPVRSAARRGRHLPEAE